MFWHIIDRFIIHFFCSMGAVTSGFFALRTLARHKRNWPIPSSIPVQLIICSMAVILVAYIREPFDVSSGDPTYKSIIDLTSWILGCVSSYIGIKRLIWMDWR